MRVPSSTITWDHPKPGWLYTSDGKSFMETATEAEWAEAHEEEPADEEERRPSLWLN